MFDDPAERRAAERVGTTIAGKYKVERVIGIGGMAAVYAAAHRNGNRVAIKMLHPEISMRSDLRARFLREGYVANKVAHPGAVRVFDDDIADDGSAFLVMDLLTGETVDRRLRRCGGILGCREALALGYQLLDVLEAAHAVGIVHRDIKPENLFITTDRSLKVLDFGIARIEDDPGVTATAAGTRLGTPAFMPPEVALGRIAEIDARTDLWSVGATLFQLLSGRLVHESGSAAETVVRAATVPARSLESVAEHVPLPIVRVVDRALAFGRADRWESARAMRDAVAEAHTSSYGEPIDPRDIAAVPAAAPDDQARRPVGGGATGDGGADASAAPRRHSVGASTMLAADPSQPTPPARLPVVARVFDPAAATAGEPDPGSTPPPDPPTSPSAAAIPDANAPQATPRRTGSGRRAMAIAIALAAIGVAVVLAATRATTTDVPRVRGSAAPSAVAACTTHQACVDASEGHPAICRKGACVALESQDCRVLASPEDVANEGTVWFGAMWQRTEDPTHYAVRSANAVDLARRDFGEMAGGLPPVRPGDARRPLGIVLCDDATDPARAATHLVDDVGVPAVIGFSSSKVVLDLVTSHFQPRGVLTLVAVGSATMLRDLPTPAGSPRLLWRVTSATDDASWPIAATLAQVLEPELRAGVPGLGKEQPIRVAQLRQEGVAGQATVDSRIASVRFNGKSVADNGDAFRLIARPDVHARSPEDRAAANEKTARELAVFRPHVVLDLPPSLDLLVAIEAAWPADATWRPRYVSEGTWSDLGPAAFDWRRDRLHERLLSVDHESSGAPLLRFALRYSEFFSPRVTPATAPNAPYDGLYLLAYAAVAVGDNPITGASLSTAIARLSPPGEPLEIGPGGIYPAFLALAAGKNVDLRGTASSLDLDPTTGETKTTFALYCLDPGEGDTPARQIESGVIFDPVTRRLTGERRCGSQGAAR